VENVSVIITCYNLERFVGAAIESALAQDCAEAPEIIVVDDCSTDGSERVVRNYPVRYLKTDRNGGSLLAMLAGVGEASNDLVCLLDGDDVWRSDKLRKIGECFASSSRIAFVTHDLRSIDIEGLLVGRDSRPREVLGHETSGERSECIRRGILTHGDYVWLGSALCFRRSLAGFDDFAEWARSLPDPANTYQDWPLAFWIAANSDVELGYVPEELFDYRLHDSNHSGDASTPAKAIRNFRRARNTVAAMREIASMRRLPNEIKVGLDERVSFLDYVIDLYSGRRTRAAIGWLHSLGYARRKGIVLKETARFLGIQAMGAARFASASSKRRMLRNLPVS
jgi:glycosyltransferase involved in cell wall biosynthesis